jgi:hypothetical protein
MLELLTPKNLVLAWLGGFIVAGLALSVGQKLTSQLSCWGANRGWQNEIAIWNLGATVMIIGVLNSNAGVEAALLPGLFVLSLAFTVNHVLALIKNRGQLYLTNVAAAAGNAGGVLLIGVYYLIKG